MRKIPRFSSFNRKSCPFFSRILTEAEIIDLNYEALRGNGNRMAWILINILMKAHISLFFFFFVSSNDSFSDLRVPFCCNFILLILIQLLFVNCISRWNFCSFHGVHRKAITYKLSDVTSGFPLRLPLYFSREQISPRTISSRFPILYPKGLAWPYILSLVLHPTFRREKKFRLISRIDSVHRAKMRACIPPIPRAAYALPPGDYRAQSASLFCEQHFP